MVFVRAPGRPASADSLCRIASLTKPITASTVLISERAGRLSRTDKLNRLLTYAEPAPTLDELIKHIPGHGRAAADSHVALPRVDAPLEELRRHDFVAFKALSHMPMAMNIAPANNKATKVSASLPLRRKVLRTERFTSCGSSPKKRKRPARVAVSGL